MLGFSAVLGRRSHARSRRGPAWLVALLAAALLPLAPLSPPPAAYADPPVFDGKEIKDLCTIGSGGQSCPVFPPPPGLLNGGAMLAGGPAVAESLQALEEQAIEGVMADHQLPASDYDAVKSWGRTEAQARLWDLVVEAINTPAADRTVDQQNAVVWMAALASAQANDSAMHAGAEYTTWAGLDPNQYWNLARNPSTTAADLTAFLSADVRTRSPYPNQPRGGYCQYRPPDPYAADYDGSDTVTCFAACPSIFGCPIPTPEYDEFVDWGLAAATYGNLLDPAFVSQAAWIATAQVFGLAVGAAAVAAGLTLASGIGVALAGTAIGAAVFPFATGPLAVAAGGAAAGAGVIAAAAAAVVVVVILAIVIAILEGIRVADNAKLPGKIADLVVNARTTTSDPVTLIGTTSGASTLYNLFVGATLPLPRHDEACDNSLVPPTVYGASFDPNIVFYVPLGSDHMIGTLADRSNCLNPPPIRPATQTDPHFLVDARTGSSEPVVAQTIGILNPTTNITQTVRLSGNWFVTRRGVGSAFDVGQSLRLSYMDWDGVTNFAWLMRKPSGDYVFVGYETTDSSTTVDPDTCDDDGTCFASDTLEYVGTDGNDYSASVEAFVASSGEPTYTPATPVEASPVTFDAGDFAPGSSDGHLTYTWRFQNLGCGWIECVLAGQSNPDGTAVTSYSAPVVGKTASHIWQSIGRAKVELTASDQHGHSATTVFVVDVGNVPPTALALHEYSTTVGTEVTVQGVASDVGNRDDLNIAINLGDGTQKSTKVGENSIPLFDPAITRLRLGSEARWSILTTHTYDEPGIYYGTFTVSDWGGGTDFDTFVVRVTGAQEITFPAVDDHVYGEVATMAATGTASGRPVTYTAGPPGVCEASGENGAAIKMVGVGECTVTSHQAEYLPVFLEAPPVERTFDVDPAPLTIRAENKTKVYGAADPTYTASFDALVNGDTADDIAGLDLVGPPTGSDVGAYDITASGATNPNYDIGYATGTQTITPAELTITAEDKTKVYGAADPDFTASFEGLVNGDTEDDVTGLTFAGPPTGSDVGDDYAITVADATNPNYDMGYVDGTLTITPAPLTITADDKTKVYGAPDPAYTASFDGLVNGDTGDEITGIVFAGPPTGSDVGEYDITATGATNPNYDVDYATGTQTITPAPLRITAHDRTKVYGARNPTYTAASTASSTATSRRRSPGWSSTARPRAQTSGGTPSGPPVPPIPTTTSSSPTAP